ncbi:Flavin-Reduct domain-containing protein [Fusarium keratoplasticum]|uniref:Flavin-Reduct domain-containing protein n=1 Tax=Fusarium keratoplasticum TaxID=1328300 RepID=A0ACC0R582_9HYPO|nr:Flavin-Reduct domain-containing protein [Fusarium keratoplasticum]KAI8671641.1 Flavin-Reduct domain-containing protein [Fusarium keratoplasticum]KAI8678863.1 Flavin-Reduct domain-containing protein [Fusarium keratoplasticum]
MFSIARRRPLNLSPRQIPLTTTRCFNTSPLFTMADQVKRNPHPDFKGVEASRPEWNVESKFRYTKTVNPDWKFGDGANKLHEGDAGKKHVAIDPHEEGRNPGFNYKFLISAITPRPIAFVSTRSADGSSTNLAPFSYFNMVNHDPPLFVVGIASGLGNAKDTLRNVSESGECVINIISEPFVEAANSASANAPYGVSEWDISGLTPVYDCETVKCARVGEAVVSIEAKLDTLKEYDSRARPGNKSGTIAIFEGTRFWVREDAINEEKNLVDPQVLRPISRLGGITYGRTTEVMEIPRVDFEKDVGGLEGAEKLKKQNSQ